MAAQPAAPDPRLIERELDRLQADIQQLRIDYQRFLAGDLHLPPDEQREKIQTRLRRLRSDNFKGAAERFRLGTLEAQLNSYAELYSRRLRAREEGLGRRRVPAEEEPRPDPEKGVVIGAKPSATDVAVLYQGLYLRDGNRQPKTDLDSFRAYLDRQAEMIRQKTGCSDIVFRVALEEGKMKLKAKPLPRN